VKWHVRILLTGIMFMSGAVHADVPAAVQQAIQDFVQQHPGRGGLRPEIEFAPMLTKVADCRQPLSVALNGRPRPWGRVSFNVRCNQPVWSLSVPVNVHMYGSYLVATRFLATGTVLAESDLGFADGDLSVLPDDVVRQPGDAVGRSLSRTLVVGTPIGLNTLRDLAVIKAGDRVRVILTGTGFQAAGDASALSAAGLGESIKLKMSDGQQLQGQVTRPGTVEVRLD
jgi:flagella basal body P-ring formation protein FlgA